MVPSSIYLHSDINENHLLNVSDNSNAFSVSGFEEGISKNWSPINLLLSRALPGFLPTLAKHTSLRQIGEEIIPKNTYREKIAIEEIVNKAKEFMNSNGWGIIFLKSETGTGKSLLLPPSFLATFPESTIYVTEPLIEIAKSNPKKIAKIFPQDFEVGMNLGFETSEEVKLPSAINGTITIMTIAIASLKLGDIVCKARKGLISAPSQDKMMIVAIDEVHVTSFAMYQIFNYVISLIMMKWPILVILMSANIETPSLISHFAYMTGLDEDFFAPGYMFVSGDIIMRAELCLTLETERLLLEIAHMIMAFKGTHKSETTERIFSGFLKKEDRKKSIIVFFEDTNMINAFEELCKKYAHKMDGAIVAKATSPFLKAFMHNSHLISGEQKIPMIILASNAVQFGVTIEWLVLVVVSGRCKKAVFNPIINSDTVFASPITASDIEQQNGRVGRTNKGMSILCMKKDIYKKLPYNIGVGTVECIDEYVLSLAQDDPQALRFLSFPLPDKLTLQSILSSILRCKTWGLIDKDMNITELGIVANGMSRMKMSLQNRIPFLYSFIFDVPPTLILLILILLDKKSIPNKVPKNCRDTFHFYFNLAVDILDNPNMASKEISRSYFELCTNACTLGFNIFKYPESLSNAILHHPNTYDRVAKCFEVAFFQNKAYKVDTGNFVMTNGLEITNNTIIYKQKGDAYNQLAKEKKLTGVITNITVFKFKKFEGVNQKGKKTQDMFLLSHIFIFKMHFSSLYSIHSYIHIHIYIYICLFKFFLDIV